jgi:hypothetical protein
MICRQINSSSFNFGNERIEQREVESFSCVDFFKVVEFSGKR